MNAAMHCMPLSLAPGAILRIDRGARIGLHAAAGLIWLTERGNAHDRVLAAGDSVQLSRNGRALVAASSPSRIVLEIPRDLDAAPRIELADGEGRLGRELPLPQVAVGRVTRILATIAKLCRRLRLRRKPAARRLDEHRLEGALAIRLRSMRREDAWHLGGGGADPLARRDPPYPFY